MTHRLAWLMVCAATVLPLASCAGVSNQNQDLVAPPTTAPPTTENTNLKVRLEFWNKASAKSVSNGGCTLTANSGWDESISRGESVAVVGPDDVELAASQFERGQYKTSTSANDKSYWVNAPSRPVCTFEADFGDVPPVATYRLKYRGIGISDLSFPQEEREREDGTLTVIFGGKVRN